MIARLNLSWRVGMILVLGLFAGWLTLISGAYLSQGVDRSAAPPTPERLAALAALVERMGRQDRDRLMAAVRTPYLAVWTEPEPLTASHVPDLLTPDAIKVAAYREALAPRALVVVPRPHDHPLRAPVPSAFNALEFRIGLAGGETLVVVTESPLFVTPVGLPIGFGPALIGVLVALVALVLMHREFRPLARLAAAVDTVAPAGEGSAPSAALPTIRARTPEIRALVAAFERLQGRIDTLIRARMALVGGIQHDLRTFATRLRLRIDKIADPEDRARAAVDIDDMIALMDDALLASRAGARELDEELVDLAPLIAADVADRRAGGAAVALAVHGAAAEATVLGDRLALRRIVGNLVDNALRYGQRAHLALAEAGASVVLTVDDEGPGIPLAERALLLEPFTRRDASRARAAEGAGLGLAVVRSLVEAHGGSVEIAEAPTGGARLTVSLPRFRPG
ncbi:MAG: ATP-binding protein [Pseudomonadota bacterium]